MLFGELIRWGKTKKQPTWDKSAVFRVRAKLAIKLFFIE
jgi:hypothetical protein